MAEAEQPTIGSAGSDKPKKAEYALKLTEDIDRADWIEHLGSLYSLESTLVNVAITIAAAATPILVGFVLDLPARCSPDPVFVYPVMEPERCLHDVHFLALPIVPLLVLLVYFYVFFNGRVVGKYLRELERKLAPPVVESETKDGNKLFSLPFPALGRLNGAKYGAETRTLTPLRLVFTALAIVVFAVSLGSVLFVLSQVGDSTLRVVAITIYGLLVLGVLYVFSRGASHTTFDELIRAVIRRDRAKADQYEPFLPWSLFTRFALVPRILSIGKGQDAVVVAVIVLILGYWSGAGWAAIGLIAAYEVVLYQTRYLLNGLREDPRVLHLPGNVRNDEEKAMAPLQQVVGLLIAVVRILLFVMIAWQLGLSGDAIAWFTGAFGAVYLAYEIPREHWRGKLKGLVASGGDISTSVAAALAHRSVINTGWLLFVLAGSGYGLRVAFALYVMAPQALWSPFGVGLVAAVWAVASAQVAAGWVVELQGARRARSRTLHTGILAKPQLYWAASRFHGTTLIKVRVFSLKLSRATEEVTSWNTRAVIAPWEGASVLSLCAILVAVVVSYPSWVRAVGAALVVTAALVRAWYLSHHEGARYPVLLGWPAVAVAGGAVFALVIDQGWRPALAYGLLAAWLVFRLMTSRVGVFDRFINTVKEFWDGAAGIWAAFLLFLGGVAKYLFGHAFVGAFENTGKKRRDQWLGP